MRDTIFKTVSVPQSGSRQIPAVIQAGAEPLRVLVRNTGGGLLIVSLSATSFVDAVPAPDTYQIPAGQSDSLVLAPNQKLCLASVGAGGTASIAASEALTQYDLRS